MYGMGALVTKAARFYPERMAVADINGELSYAQLNDSVNRIANYLLYLGLKKGDRLGFVCDNCVEFAQLWLATQKTGIVSVFLNYRATQEEISRDVRRSRCQALFYSPKWKSIISRRDISGSGVRFLISFGDDTPDGHISLSYICRNSQADEPQVDIAETDWSTILYTSGSTGLSKGVVRTHRMVFEYAMQMAAEHEYYKTERVCILSHSPLFHTGGLSQLMKSLALSGSLVVVNGVDPELISALIEKYRSTQLFFVPPVNIMRFDGSQAVKARDLSSVNHIWATGGKLSEEYVLKMLELFPGCRVKTSYGGTEFCSAGSISHCLTPQQVSADPELLESACTIGLFADVRLVDENGADAALGEPGELLVSSPFVMEGYLDDPEETARVLVDGWYHTGDVFRMDRRGLMYFMDRKSSMIKTGGENVYPNEVESVLRRHDKVVDCAVVALPDPKWEQAVAAAIVPAGELELSELIDFARQNLAGYKKPQYYLLLDELPRTASGKIDRRALLNSQVYRFKSIKEIN